MINIKQNYETLLNVIQKDDILKSHIWFLFKIPKY